MGTDIYAAYQVDSGGVYDVSIDRNYALFGLLAGSRGNVKPMAPPRGVPKDATPFTLRALRGGALVEASWFTIDELISADYDQLVQRRGYSDDPLVPLRSLIDPEWFALLDRLKEIGPGRLIFDFD
jgi:hypothetical protein